MRTLAILLVVVGACGGGQKQNTTPDPNTNPPNTNTTTMDPTGPLSEEECDKLWAHIIDLYSVGQEDMDYFRRQAAEKRDQYVAACQAQFPRAAYACMMKTTDLPELSRCGESESG